MFAKKNAMSSKPVDGHVGRRLRMRRLMLNISQEELAKEVGITFQQVQKYEQGVNRIGASRLYEFSCILGVGIDYFFEGAEESVDRPQPHSSAKETLQLIRSYYNIKSKSIRHEIGNLLGLLGGGE